MESKLLIQVLYDGTPTIRIKCSRSEEDVRDQLVRRFVCEGSAGPCWLRMISSNEDTGEMQFQIEPLSNTRFMEQWPALQAHADVLQNWPDGKKPVLTLGEELNESLKSGK